MNKIIRFIIITLVLTILWQAMIWIFELPKYLLPTPLQVLQTLVNRYELLLQNSWITLLEIIVGLLLGVVGGISTAFVLFYFKRATQILLPILLISQAIPVFAIAPLLVLWFGFGFTSKLVMTLLIVYFPVASSAFDGIKNTPQEYLLLAKSCNVSPLKILLKVRLPAALPTISSGIRVAATIAPIGAIIGEWVGASSGLGYLMLVSNARMQIDVLFAALLILIVMTLTLYYFTDFILKKIVFWNGIC